MASERASPQPDAYAHTRAAAMLTEAIQGQKRAGRSLRTIAKELNYKQATVLSHMAHGRVPVPLERAADIARAFNLPADEFLRAAIEQRVPESRELLRESRTAPHNFGLAQQISLIAGVELDQLNEEQQAVIKEIAADPKPRRRWLNIGELSALMLLRDLLPDLPQRGLSPHEAESLRKALAVGRT